MQISTFMPSVTALPLMSFTAKMTVDVSVWPEPLMPITCGVALVKLMLPAEGGITVMEATPVYDETVAVTVTEPPMEDALNVALATPAAVVDVLVMVPSVETFKDHVTVVPSGAFAPVPVLTVAVTLDVPPDETELGSATTVIANEPDAATPPAPRGPPVALEDELQPTNAKKAADTAKFLSHSARLKPDKTILFSETNGYLVKQKQAIKY
jgi:hypothetical protein